MVGRTPGNVVRGPAVRDGVISEFDVTQVMLEYFIGKVHEQSIVPLPQPAGGGRHPDGRHRSGEAGSV